VENRRRQRDLNLDRFKEEGREEDVILPSVRPALKGQKKGSDHLNLGGPIYRLRTQTKSWDIVLVKAKIREDQGGLWGS